MKKLFSLFILFFSVCLFIGCGGTKDDTGPYPNEGNLNPPSGLPIPDKDSAQEGLDGIRDPGDQYTEIVENSIKNTEEYPNSTFSLDVNTSSYPSLRNYIQNDIQIQKNMVRIEEMLNYFSYDYNTPEDDSILALSSSVFPCPWNSENQLMTIGLKAKDIEYEDLSNNIVFLIDVSGSMYGEDKIELAKKGFLMLLDNMNENDILSVVTYSNTVDVLLDGVTKQDKESAYPIIRSLTANGGTSGGEAIQKAYEVANKHLIDGGNNRIVLITDGDFNIGIYDTNTLTAYISDYASTGVYFSAFGVGYGNMMANRMEALCLAGNGVYSYLDSEKEARRAFVTNLGATMITVAKDTKAQVRFNKDVVSQYRLIGYENKLLSEEDFENSNKDAGEINSGYTITVVYEITTTHTVETEEVLSTVELRYKNPENQEDLSLSLAVKGEYYHEELTSQDKFISAVVAFGLVLRDSNYKGTATTPMVQELLRSYEETDPEKREFIQLVDLYYVRFESEYKTE